MREIDVYWQEPIKVLFDSGARTYHVPVPEGLSSKGGVYQVYGDHPSYGPESLMYIGKAGNFCQRMEQHLSKERGRFWHHVGLTVSLGLVQIAGQLQNSRELFEEVEALLIATHLPSLNDRSKNSLPDSCLDLFVYNWDWRKQVIPLVSGRLFKGPVAKAEAGDRMSAITRKQAA